MACYLKLLIFYGKSLIDIKPLAGLTRNVMIQAPKIF